jgi:hypothetical protein
MTRTIAIAALAVRTTIRSRLFITLAMVLLLVIFVLPLTIKGDGTAAGQIRILLYYTLGLACTILGVTTLWTSCAAISHEIDEKQIQMSVAKPVHRFQIWMGKWIGILAVNAILLLITGAAIYAYARHYAGSPGLGEKDRMELDNELLVGRRLVVPVKESIEHDVRERLDQLKREGKLKPGITKAEAVAQAQKALLLERSVVAPDQSKRWAFQTHSNGGFLSGGRSTLSGADGRSAVTIRFRFVSTFHDRKRVTGTWIVAGKDGRESFRFEMKDWMDGPHSISVPVSAMPPGDITVTFANAGRDRSNLAVFDFEEPIQMLIREDSFAPNLVRSLVVILCQLGLIAAIGLTAGSIFSFPVATFAATSLLVISMAGHYFIFTSSSWRYGVDEDDKVEMTVLRAASEKVVRHLEVVIAPVMELAPLGLLSDGILVSWRFTGKAIMLLLILYPVFFWLVGSWFLNKRELALPVT